MRRPCSGAVLDDLEKLFDVGTSAGLSDGQLLDRYLSRANSTGETAFTAIVQRHGPMVHRVCHGVLKDLHDADDAFQATFLILARKAPSIRGGDSMASWLYGVARRVAIHLRKERVRRTARETSIGPRIEEHLATRKEADLMPEIQEEIDRLPEKYRATIVLCDLEGLTHAEAASALRVPVGTVKVRLFRGRERLRGRFARRGLALELLAVSARVPNPYANTSSILNSTIQAAMQISAGKAAETSTPVAALVQGVLRAMVFAKLKSVLMLLAVSIPVLLTAGLARSQGPHDQAPQRTGDAPAPRTEEVNVGQEVVLSEAVQKSDFSGVLRQQVTLEPASRISVFSAVPGKLKSLLVDVGDHATKGQVLAELEAPMLQEELAEAEAIVEREQARVEQAATRLKNAKAGLIPLSSKTKPDSDTMLRASTEEATADLTIARAELKVSLARCFKARGRLALTRVVSPLDGVVTRRLLQVGEYTRGQEDASSSIFQILDTSRIIAQLLIPERDLPFVHKGDPVMLSNETATADPFKGRVARLDVIEVTTSNGSSAVPALIEFDNPKLQLRPGKRAAATLELARQQGVLTIPIGAIVSSAGDEIDQSGTCYRFVQGGAVPTRVKLGSLGDQGRRIQVLSGLSEGDRVITQPRLVKHVRKVDP